jgi:hypothetical protein
MNSLCWHITGYTNDTTYVQFNGPKDEIKPIVTKIYTLEMNSIHDLVKLLISKSECVNSIFLLYPSI